MDGFEGQVIRYVGCNIAFCEDGTVVPLPRKWLSNESCFPALGVTPEPRRLELRETGPL